MLIINAKVYTMAEPGIIERGFISVNGGLISDVGDMASAPDGDSDVFDAGGGFVLPGLVDAHCHLGLWEDALGFEGDDGNEETDPSTPQLRAVDGINPLDRCFKEALSAGVTSCVVSPGSANPIGGQLAAIKTYGSRIDDMIISAPCGIKFALGENPKHVYHHRDEAPFTRMATAAIMRETLFKAREYSRRREEALRDDDADEPEFDFKLEALVPLLKGDLTAFFHAHRADDIFTAIRIAREFSLRYVILHGTDGHLIADALCAEGARVAAGPMLGDRSKPELKNLTLSNAGALSRAGVLTAICTDHPETPLKYLMLSAAMCAARGGMDELEALKAVTVNAAKIAGIEGRVGSLQLGNDADIVVYREHPFSLGAQPFTVFAGGRRMEL